MGSGASVVDDEGVVRIGSVVFALIRPTPGHEQAFDRWYGRDHYYTAGLAAPGVFSAGRFVHPDTRLHLALYFVLPGHDGARVAFATEQVEAAAGEHRLFAEREHLHTWSYEQGDTWRADPAGVPPALALDHRYPMITVAMYDMEDPRGDGRGWSPEPSTGIDSIIGLRPGHRIMASTWDGDIDPVTRRLAIAFHREPSTADVFADIAGLIWSSSFRPVVFGTDNHIVD
jgi:hypothetical protein